MVMRKNEQVEGCIGVALACRRAKVVHLACVLDAKCVVLQTAAARTVLISQGMGETSLQFAYISQIFSL